MSKQLFWNGKSDENWSNSLEWLKWVYFHYIKSKATNCTDLFADLAMDWLSVKIQTEEELELLVLLSKLLHSLYLKCTCFTCAEKISRIHLVDSALNTIFKFLIKDQTTKHRVCWTFLRIVPINNQKFDSFPKFIRGQPCSKHIVEVSGWSVKPTKKGLIRPWWYTCKIKLKINSVWPPPPNNTSFPGGGCSQRERARAWGENPHQVAAWRAGPSSVWSTTGFSPNHSTHSNSSSRFFFALSWTNSPGKWISTAKGGK